MAELRRMRPLLGTFVEVGVVECVDTNTASLAISQAFATIELLQTLLNFQNPDSELSRLNRCVRALTLHPISVLALRLARGMTRASGGLFNCTVGGRMIQAGVLPNHADHLPLLNGDANDISISGHNVALLRPVQITLDGIIAKGLAVDLAARSLRSFGIEAGWINAGGDLLAFGKAAIFVHRRELNGALTPLDRLCNGAIASSAVRAMSDQRFPSQIVSDIGIAPSIGVWSVHAAHAHAWRADALTKVAALADQADRAMLIARLGGRLLEPLLFEKQQEQMA